MHADQLDVDLFCLFLAFHHGLKVRHAEGLECSYDITTSISRDDPAKVVAH